MSSILLLEDDPSISEVLTIDLMNRGHHVMQAPRVRLAEKLHAGSAPDVLVVDGLLPDGTGLDFIERLRRAGSLTPIVFFSAFWRDSRSMAHLQRTLKVDAVLRKPHDVSAVGRTVDSLLDGRKRAPALASLF